MESKRKNRAAEPPAKTARELQKALNALKKCEEEKALILDAASEMFALYDTDLRIQWTNKAAARALNMDKSAMIGRHCYELWHHRSAPCPDCPVLKALETGKPEEGEIVTSDQQVYLLRSYPMFDENNAVSGLIEFGRNITARKQSEKALQTQRDIAQNYLDIAAVAIVAINADGVVTLVNKRGCGLLGYREEEIVGKNWFAHFIPEADRDQISDVFAKLMAGEKDSVEYVEGTVTTKSGEERLLAWHNSLLFDDAGRIIGTLSSGEDITERKRAENELQRLKDQLQAENIYLREEIRMEHGFEEIIGDSDGLRYILFKVRQVAPADTTVLILGETGTGKDLIARAIHNMSPRSERSLVKADCAALPSRLIESELFGHEKGAFTGAGARRIGRFELADGATLFLDEIGELPLETQGKLLRALQDGEFERLGSSRTIRVDVRVIAVTNRDLDAEVRAGRFRQDLYYRLSAYPITTPPLRDRVEDIPLLAQTFLKIYNKKLGKTVDTIPRNVMAALQQYPWPGNVRELKNVIERAVITAQGNALHVDLPRVYKRRRHGIRPLESVERDHIRQALEFSNWRIEGSHGAAKVLGLHPSTLRFRMRKLGIRRPDSPL